jgi:hypothetical protein
LVDKQIMANKKKTKTDESNFAPLDRLARSITPAKLRLLTPQQRERWKAAKRGGLKGDSAPKR